MCASTATIDTLNKLSPGRTPPCKSGPGLPVEKYTRSSSGSTAGVCHTGAPPNCHAVLSARPRVVTEFSGPRHGVERPHELAVARAERVDLAAARHLAAREARDDHPVVVQRRARDAEAVLPPLGLDGPDDLARALIERDEPRVVQADEDLALAHRDTAARAAHRHAGARVGTTAIGPEDRARVGVEREHVVRAVDHEERARVMQDLRLARVVRRRAGAHARAPQRLQVLDVVAIEQRQRRVALVEDVAAVRDPVRRRVRRSAGVRRTPAPSRSCAAPLTVGPRCEPRSRHRTLPQQRRSREICA